MLYIADYGHFVLRASMPSVLATDKESNDYSSFTPSQTTFTPYLFKTALTAYETTAEDTTIEFTSTQHGGIMRATFPTYVNDSTSSGFDQTRRITVGINGDPDTAIISTDYLNTLSISGMTSKSSGGTSKGFEFYFIAAIFTGEKGDVPVTTADSRYTDSSWAFLDFSPHVAGHDKFTVRLSTSFISLDQALLNLKSEVGLERSFESIVEESKADWNNVLSRVNIEEISSTYSESEQSDLLTTFYSSLFRASLFPRQLSETDVTGQLVHWSPYDNQVHPGDFSTDSGFWDAYNTVYPLLTLINTPRLATTIRGWLNAYTEGLLINIDDVIQLHLS